MSRPNVEWYLSELDKPPRERCFSLRVVSDLVLKALLDYIIDLEQERDRLRKVHEAELGVCEQHCEVVAQLTKRLHT